MLFIFKLSGFQLRKKVSQSFAFWDWKRLPQSLLKISPKEATVQRRGFEVSEVTIGQRLEKIGCTFLDGYNAVIAYNQPEVLIPYLKTINSEYQGFAFEGAAMGLTILDYFTPWNDDRIQRFLQGDGADHIYMVYVGIGWALARLPGSLKSYLAQLNNPHSKLDTLLRWLAIDGYGFHQGYFHWRKYIQEKIIPSELSGYALWVFDQGLGRSLWFTKGADIKRISQTIKQFPAQRRADLWSGVGLACAYAGGVQQSDIEVLKRLVGDYLPNLAQGVAFAAKARQKAGNPTEYTEMTCQIIWGLSAEATAMIPDQAMEGLLTCNKSEDLLTETITIPSIQNPKSKIQNQMPAYEIWRRSIQKQFK